MSYCYKFNYHYRESWSKYFAKFSHVENFKLFKKHTKNVWKEVHMYHWWKTYRAVVFYSYASVCNNYKNAVLEHSSERKIIYKSAFVVIYAPWLNLKIIAIKSSFHCVFWCSQKAKKGLGCGSVVVHLPSAQEPGFNSQHWQKM